MKESEYDIVPIAECSVMLRFHGDLQESVIASISQLIETQFAAQVMNITPAYHKILIDYLPFRLSESQLLTALHQLMSSVDLAALSTQTQRLVTLPVYYAHETALDLQCYRDKNVSLEQLIEIHIAQTYTVSAIGFAPGFAFLSGVSPAIQLPRLATPRVHIPAGSVGIADDKTAIYPSASPGGWNIIGRCPTRLFDPNHDPILPYQVGDAVRFAPVSRQEFLALGGVL